MSNMKHTEEEKQKYNKALEDLYKKHPELNTNADEHYQAMKYQVQTSGVKKEQSELEAQKLAKMISNFGNAKHIMTDEQKEINKKYLDQVMALPSRVKYVGKEVNIGYDLAPINRCKAELWKIMEADLKRQGRGFDFSAKAIMKVDGKKVELSYKQLIVELLKYFIRSKDSMFDLRKGLCLFGIAGVGKSWLMKMMRKFLIQFNSPTSFGYANMIDIVDDYRIEKDVTVIKRNMNGSMYYDDVGAENIRVVVYKNEDCVFERILLGQYERFKNTGKKIHITTNLLLKGEGDTIEAKYGQRVSSRCQEMMNFVWLKGDNKRE